MGNRKRQAGFTLVEILIVVVILGILAAIVIPQFTSASESAKASSLKSQLQTMRSQLELYQIQHNGDYPTLAATGDADAIWQEMIDPHGIDPSTGNLDYAEDDLGPYLQQPPANPFQTGDARFTIDVVTDGTDVNDGASGVGWTYNSNSGRVKAVLPDSVDPEELGLSESDYVGGATTTEE